MKTLTIFQAGQEIISTGTDLDDAIKSANEYGFDLDINGIELAKPTHGLVDGKIYYTHDYENLFSE
jgi:hypothetical protein